MTTQQPFPPSPGPGSPNCPGSPNGPGEGTHHRKRWLKYGAVALASLLVGVAIGSTGSGDTGNATNESKAGPRPTVTVTETVTAEPEEKPGPVISFPGEGKYLVGEDIEAGIYKTAGPANQWGCYWELTKNASGEFNSILANDDLDGPGSVMLANGEYFETNWCQEWTRVE